MQVTPGGQAEDYPPFTELLVVEHMYSVRMKTFNVKKLHLRTPSPMRFRFDSSMTMKI
jgi:hypothetical protein